MAPLDLGDSGELAAELLLTGTLSGAITDDAADEDEGGSGGGFSEQHEQRLWKGDTPATRRRRSGKQVKIMRSSYQFSN